jgi:hypothetical protein
MPRNWYPGPPPVSRYQPLVEFVAAYPEPAVTLTFEQIEAIIGSPLPVSACVSPAYWSWPHGNGLAHVRLLRAAGWDARLDYRRGCVRFTRDAGEE